MPLSSSSACVTGQRSSVRARGSPDQPNLYAPRESLEPTEANEDEDPPDEIQILITRRTVSCDANCPCSTLANTFLQFFGGCIKHWALRVGEDVYSLYHEDGVNFVRRHDYDGVKMKYEAKDVLGRTREPARIVKRLADTYIKGNPHYDFVQANCQQFVYWLAGAIPKCSDPDDDPSFAGHEFWKILDDIRRYLTKKEEASSRSVKQTIDTVVQGLKHAASTAAGMIIGKIMSKEKIKHGVNWVINKLPHDALTWIVEGLTRLLHKMRPLLGALAGTLTSAWACLSSPLGLKILAGVAIVAAVCGAAWLAYEGGKRFWCWWKKHGNDLDFDNVIIEMHASVPGQYRPNDVAATEIAVQCGHRRARIVQLA